MKAELWVKIQGKKRYGMWDAGKISSSKNKPDTDADEVAIKLVVIIPDSYFATPELKATVTLPDPTDKHISTEVANNISEELSKQTGLRIHLMLPKEDEAIETEGERSD